jgi:peptide/nickel transport system substrate-binding protein
MDWKNDAFEAALKVTETELDPAKRKAAWADMQHIYADQLPSMPLFFMSQVHIIPTWLRGYVPAGMSDYPTLRGEYWTAE